MPIGKFFASFFYCRSTKVLDHRRLPFHWMIKAIDCCFGLMKQNFTICFFCLVMWLPICPFFEFLIFFKNFYNFGHCEKFRPLKPAIFRSRQGWRYSDKMEKSFSCYLIDIWRGASSKLPNNICQLANISFFEKFTKIDG